MSKPVPADPPSHIRPMFDRFYPELALCRDAAERAEAMRLAQRSSPGLSASVIIPVVVFLAYMCGVPAVYLWARPNWLPMASMSFVMIPAIPIYFFGLMFAVRAHQRRAIRRFLFDRGVPVCVPCGYDLRGIQSSQRRCPECGRAIEANQSAAQPAAPAQ